MLVDLKTWISAVITGYNYAYGMWVETTGVADKKYCVLQHAGGPQASPVQRNPVFRLILLGRRDHPEDSQSLIAGAQAIIEACVGPTAPCRAMAAKASEPQGPGLTTENRAWVALDLQLMY